MRLRTLGISCSGVGVFYAPTVLIALTLLALSGCVTREVANSGPKDYCKPSQGCWPSAAAWQSLRSSLTGKLIEVNAPLQACRDDAGSVACAAVRRELKNPYAIEDDPGATQSLGWLGAWDTEPSAYAVAPENAQDVAAAIDFARKHRLRLVVKGTGHDYLGRSSAPDSLLVWTHPMRKVTVEDAFVGQGCATAIHATPAVTVEAGTRWLEAYQEVTLKHGRYVQGGGCTSVGAAGGFLQGGGFGSWSNKFGTAASSLLQAEVVTADGKVRVANACQNQDLYWALRGGGGGTFGIVTRATLQTHPLPHQVGFIIGRVEATSDAAFHDLLLRFIAFFRENLANENWGEQVHVRGNNSLDLSMSFAAISADQARQVWQPFLSALGERPGDFKVHADFIGIPGNRMWDEQYIREHIPTAIRADDRSPDSPYYWWASTQEEVATYWYAYQSRWLPMKMFEPAQARALADTLFDASRRWSVALHFNKGQAAASGDAVNRGRQTAMNPKLYDAAALVIIAANTDAYAKGATPDPREGEEARAGVSAAMKVIRAAAPDSGAYANEADYFEPDWQRSFWGENYPKLLAVKRKYDPDGLFRCHHCVGSEEQ